MKKVVSLTRRAIEQYNMIEDGDKIAVGVSGGKDSLVLLNVLAELSRYYPKKFTVMGLTLDMGYDCLLYTSDAADEEDSVNLCGRPVIKKKKRNQIGFQFILYVT